jgi:DNA repair protein RecN (Recombination protein N)
MIDEIQVRNLALIREATLMPSRGLTVLTGETGAGKTALLSAMKLLMGARSSSDMVRDGQSSLEVSGRFYGIVPRVEDADVAMEPADEIADDELVVTRRVGEDGRSRVSVNGGMASVRELSERIAPHIDLCGQFEHQQLMKPTAHALILDSWAGEAVSAPLSAYRSALAQANDAAAELERVRGAAAESSAKLDEARFILSRIDEVSPQEGEYEELRQSLDRAEHAESLAVAVAGARAALVDDEGALDKLNAAADSLESVASFDESLGNLAASLREAGYVLEDVANEARDYRDRIEFDPETLSRQQERFAQMQGLLRAYGPTMEQVFARRDEAFDAVSLVDNAEVRQRAAEAAVAKAEEELARAADALDAARSKAAPRFAQAVTRNMERLEMAGSALEVASEKLSRSSWTKAGPSAIEFLYRPGRGMTARPLARIASGGEVSRVMLAIKVVLGETDAVDTLVFDEVDAGVGGSTANALAEVLADLAKTHQVIVVTHLAQVAVRGDTHYVVRKRASDADAAPETVLNLVEGDGRVAEIARMLSGDATETALAHAKELLAKNS